MKKLLSILLAVMLLAAAAFPVSADNGRNTRDAVGMSLLGLNTVDLYGAPVNDSIFSGYTMTVMNYWATWCGPCIGEMPDFLTLYNYYESTPENDVQLWGVLMYDYPDEIPEAIQMTEENGWTWGHMRKNAQLYNIALALVGDGSVPIPQTIIVDRNGTVRAHKRARFFDYEEMYGFINGWYETLATEEAQQPLNGDADGDGIVTVADALMVLRHAMGIITLDGSTALVCDVDHDGSVTIADALMILRFSMGIISDF